MVARRFGFAEVHLSQICKLEVIGSIPIRSTSVVRPKYAWLCESLPSPSPDRRVVLSSLTERGEQLVAERHAQTEPRWRAALDEFDAAELVIAARVLNRLADYFDVLLDHDPPLTASPSRIPPSLTADRRGRRLVELLTVTNWPSPRSARYRRGRRPAQRDSASRG